jgi:hypothetical protein
LQYSAQSGNGVTEPRHTAHLTLDNTPPAITINQPAATSYPHSATLTLNYSADDGAGSGVKSVTATLDGATSTPAGQSLASGQAIRLLTSKLALGSHTFTVISVDNVGNTSSKSVSFTIIVTPESIKDDVRQFVASGDITYAEGRSLLATLDAAATAWKAGDCKTAINDYNAFIQQVKAQTRKSITTFAASVMITDAQYLISHCP